MTTEPSLSESPYVTIRGRNYYVCTGCHHPIFRNLAVLDSKAWHYGELRMTEAFGKAIAICRHCASMITKSNLLEVGYDSVRGLQVRKCGFCGSENLQFLQDLRATEF